MLRFSCQIANPQVFAVIFCVASVTFLGGCVLAELPRATYLACQMEVAPLLTTKSSTELKVALLSQTRAVLQANPTHLQG
jgi:hypothetical protein